MNKKKNLKKVYINVIKKIERIIVIFQGLATKMVKKSANRLLFFKIFYNVRLNSLL